MKKSLNKAFLCFITVLIILITSVFPAFGADSCSIVLTSSKSSVKAGEEVTITLKLSPSSKGVAGFTITLTYDKNKFDFVSSAKGSGYDDYLDCNGLIVSGMSYSKNVTASANIATFKFKAKSNVSGSGSFSATYSELFYYGSNSEPEYVDISAGITKANVTVNSATTTTTTKATTTTTKKKTTTTTTTKKTTTTTTTTKKKTTTTTTTTPKKTTTTTTTPKKTTTTTTTPKKTTTTTTPVTVSQTTTTTPEVITTPATTTSVETITTPPETTTEETTTTTVITPPENFDTYMFKFTYESTDVFAENDQSNFIFDLSDYVDDFSKTYDLNVYVQVDGDVNGAICYNMNGEWTSNYFKSSDEIAPWEVKGIKLEESDSLIHMPVYFMSTGTSYTVGAIVVKDSVTGEIVYNGLEKITDIPDDPATSTTPSQTEISDSVASLTTTKSAVSTDKSPQKVFFLVYLVLFAIPILFVIVSVVLIIIVIKNIKDAKNIAENSNDTDE